MEISISVMYYTIMYEHNKYMDVSIVGGYFLEYEHDKYVDVSIAGGSFLGYKSVKWGHELIFL